MIKTLAKCMGKYKKESIITPIFTAVEVFLEILIPFITASIIDKGIQAGDMRKVGILLSVKLDAPAPCRLDAPDLDLICYASADCLHQHLQVI